MLSGKKRQEQIRGALIAGTQPISAGHFAKQFGVSRQTIVGDIALMRAQGEKIVATPRGYEYQHDNRHQAIIACRHRPEQIEQELTLIVQAGGSISDVLVEHPLYGQLRGELAIRTRSDVQQFIRKLNKFKGHPLAELTDGIHLHTITFENENQLTQIKQNLHDAGILYEPAS
ncbi:transcription repressor NadR [Loigolactobacillus backii]|uniref:DNA-binding protein n=1 Tax=Loigolactobacillus backii TaxID=375175 RepID=A0A192H1L7_9LACO|nr:transcription repressor NadR [Loigolactobacillus backii]ANK62132.1 DNA-binding protein [Loigolactobacillus backii]ANK68673.1 DNA-binding protein [Loigolactobacillus backii]MDA5386676.1 transcription repressor NadR [Loigolactobacillus backii]MDA5389201.1 transcription repressor NadR [Loigolactobacillus backii]